MPIHDISLPISESLTVWPGDPAIGIEQVSHLDRGDLATVSRLDMGAHTGTHVDAPIHFVSGGSGVDRLDLEVLVGPALVVHVQTPGHLSAATLKQMEIPAGVERILFRTINSDRWAGSDNTFDREFVAITPDGARWLVEHGIRLVGIDYLSVAPFDSPAPTHRELLGAGVIAVEGLDLSQIAPGFYQFVCLPLRIEGSDGAPARAILIDVEDRV
ncbi:MAG: cyclase family protein [Anaerolineae bacterium]|jgi:arylformamidase